MNSLQGKKIVLGITGSIAAYKACYIIRALIKRGAEVQVVITPAGKEFITPITPSAFTSKPVISEFFAQRRAAAQADFLKGVRGQPLRAAGDQRVKEWEAFLAQREGEKREANPNVANYERRPDQPPDFTGHCVAGIA